MYLVATSSECPVRTRKLMSLQINELIFHCTHTDACILKKDVSVYPKKAAFQQSQPISQETGKHDVNMLPNKSKGTSDHAGALL